MASKKTRFKSYDAQITPEVKPLDTSVNTNDTNGNWLAVLGMVLTSDRIDRDGDVLNPQGAIVDPESPLLWQHDMNQPLGKLLSFSMDNEHKISGTVGLLQCPQCHDVLEKAEMGVLRVSIGFVPLEMEPRKVDGRIVGQMINKYEIVEVSLVSVPSNTDAIITRIERLSSNASDSDKLKFFQLFQKHFAPTLGKRKKMSNKSLDKMIRRLNANLTGHKAAGEGDGDGDNNRDGKPQQSGDQGGKPRQEDNNQDSKPRQDDGNRDESNDNNNDPKQQLRVAIDIVQSLMKVDLSSVDQDKLKAVLGKLSVLLRSVLQNMDNDKDVTDGDEVEKEPEDMETTSASSGGNSSDPGAVGNAPSDGKNVSYLWERLMGRRS